MMNQTKATAVFTVTVKKQFPAWDEVNGIVYCVDARNKAEATKDVRRKAVNDGHVGFGQGRYTVSAVEAPEGTVSDASDWLMY